MSTGGGKRKERRRTLMGVALIIVLAGVYALKYGHSETLSLPTQARIDAEHRRLRQLRADLRNLEEAEVERLQQRARIRAIAAPYWRSDDKKLPAAEIQAQIERLGTRVGVQLNRVGAPKVMEVSDHIRAVEVQISSTTTIRKLARFFREVENHEPALVWSYCSVRPNRLKDPTGVLLSGKVVAYVLAKEASEYVNGKVVASP